MKQEDIRRIWLRCGFGFQSLSELKPQYRHEANLRWVSPMGEIGCLPDLTLDNLFLYAVPNFKNCQLIKYPDGEYVATIGIVQGRNKNPTEALASAILKVIENE